MAKENKKIKEANKTKKEKKHFFKDLKAELKKVIWPTPKQLVNNTVAVITIVLLTAIIVFVLDFVFETANTYGVDALKSAIDSSKSSENTVDANTIDGNVVDGNTVEGSENGNEGASEGTEANTTASGDEQANTTPSETAQASENGTDTSSNE